MIQILVTNSNDEWTTLYPLLEVIEARELSFPFRQFSIIYLTFQIHVDIFGVGHFKGFLITAYGEA